MLANYDGSPQGQYEMDRITQAIGFLNAIYANIPSANKSDLQRLNGIFYTDGAGRSGVDLTRGIFTLSAADMVGGYLILSVTDRIVHDAHHITQYQNGDYTPAGNYSTPAQVAAGVALERAAIAATVGVAELLMQLPAAQSTGYAATVGDLKTYIDQNDPRYPAHQQTLRNRLQQPFARASGGSAGGGGNGGGVITNN